MMFLVGVLLWGVGLVVMLSLSGWVLGPLERRAKHGSHRMQFTLGDWICLILMIQLWAAMVHSFTAVVGRDEGGALITDIYGWVLVVILWLGVVRRLSSAGIRRAWHRGVALVVIYPLNVLGSIIAPGLALAVVFSPLGRPDDSPPLVVPLACAAALALLLGAMVASAHFVEKIVTALDVEPVEKDVVDVLPASGQHSQGDETADPENGQDDRKQE